MTKLETKEHVVAKKHPVGFPVIITLGLMFMVIAILGYFLYQTVSENTRLKQKYQDNSESIDNYEEGQDQQLDSELDQL